MMKKDCMIHFRY